MDAIKFLKATHRMCIGDCTRCTKCPLDTVNNRYGVSCDVLQLEYPEEYVAIVEKWAEEHPMPTNPREIQGNICTAIA